MFALEKLATKTQEELIKKIPRRFLNVSLNFNSGNYFVSKMFKKNNCVLEIYSSYLLNYKKFNKNRKRIIKMTQKIPLYLKETGINSLLKIAKENYSYLPYKDSDYKRIDLLSKKLKNNKHGFVLGVFKDEKLLGGVFFLKDNYRITYLFSVMNKEGKKLNAITFLISELIKDFEGKNYILDFEGSMNIGIANFFKSFGAVNENYYQFKTNAFQRRFI